MTWAQTADLSDGFFAKLDVLCPKLGAAKVDLLGVAMYESGVRASARNASTNAVGLIQFMPFILSAWGHTPDSMAALSAEEQLPYVERYFQPYAGRIGTLRQVYLAVFMPAYLKAAKDPGFVLATRGGAVYRVNSNLDRNADGVITAGELEDRARGACVGPRWREIAIRAGLGLPADDSTSVSGWFDVQRRLVSMGFDPGPLDGVPGRRTATALAAFQKASGLKVDGILGPQTKAALGVA
jgi:hypothetical protein